MLRRSVLVIGLPRWQVVRRVASSAATVESVIGPDLTTAGPTTRDPGEVTAHAPPGWPAEVLPPGVDG